MKERRARGTMRTVNAIRQYRLEGVLSYCGPYRDHADRITKEDIVKSDDDGRRLILTWAASIMNLYHRWTDIYPARNVRRPGGKRRGRRELNRTGFLLHRPYETKAIHRKTGKPLTGFEAIEAFAG
jgi:hypothetical protein